MSAGTRLFRPTLAAMTLTLTIGLWGTAERAGPEPPPETGDTRIDIEPTRAQPLSRSVPVHLDVPAIDLSTPMDRLGTNADGTVAEPGRFDEPYWYSPGPAPGELGSSVILGHVDSTTGPAVFFRLGAVRAGARIDVTRADGSVARFVVTRTATVEKGAFPSDEVYRSHGDSELRLITCAGVFDREQRRYLSNLIVTAVLESPATASESVENH
ncbi:class F sortase [Nocardia jejuensis]|uniref:class F sortase n=1 Tax=Nocardia jejuensis TaxID=328049 RepID=UPI0008369BE2|nr:class F sortase [Nocardia jejuensis]